MSVALVCAVALLSSQVLEEAKANSEPPAADARGMCCLLCAVALLSSQALEEAGAGSEPLLLSQTHVLYSASICCCMSGLQRVHRMSNPHLARAMHMRYPAG